MHALNPPFHTLYKFSKKLTGIVAQASFKASSIAVRSSSDFPFDCQSSGNIRDVVSLSRFQACSIGLVWRIKGQSVTRMPRSSNIPDFFGCMMGRYPA